MVFEPQQVGLKRNKSHVSYRPLLPAKPMVIHVTTLQSFKMYLSYSSTLFYINTIPLQSHINTFYQCDNVSQWSFEEDGN